MPFKHNAARGHRIGKMKFKVLNWPEYEAQASTGYIFSRSETARMDNPCSNVSRRIDRMSFTSVCLACFRLGIMSSLKTREQSARSALTKVDLNPPLCLFATF